MARLLVGLTGGIGSGKSTVARQLGERGAVVVDADVVAREVVEPGTAGLAAVVERFGEEVLGPDGALDRPALAKVVFADEPARADLNAIVHPLVAAATAELVTGAPDGSIVVCDVPLLVEAARTGYSYVIVVEAPPETRVERLVARGMGIDDARRRMAAQASDEERRKVADVVIDNSGGPASLAPKVDAVWAELNRRLTRNV